MKTKLFIISLATVLVAVSGCKKQENAAPDAAKPAQTAATETANKVDAAATTAATDTAAKVDEAAKSAQAAAAQVPEQVAPAANQEAQGLLDKAKTFIAEKNYQDALALLNKASQLKLTAEQQALLDQLKAQVQAALGKAASGNVGSAIGGVLGGKK